MQELVKNAAKDIARAYLQEGEDPTEKMVKVAEDNDLTAQQVQPIARRANRKILVKLQKSAAENGEDPRVTFPKIKPKRVVMILRKKGKMPEEMATPPEPSDTSFLDRMFGLEDHEETCKTEGYTLDDYRENPDKIPNEEMALRVLNKTREEAEQARKRVTSVENKLEEALHTLQKQAAQYLRAGEPIEPLQNLEGVEEEIQEVQEKVACDIQSIDGEFEIREDHPMNKLAQKIQDLRQEHEEKQYNAKLAKHRLQTFKDKIKGTYL